MWLHVYRPTYAGIDGEVLCRRGAAGADPGICVRGMVLPLPSSLSSISPPVFFPSLPSPSLIVPSLVQNIENVLKVQLQQDKQEEMDKEKRKLNLVMHGVV